jgi:hypothetical protein
VESLRRVGALQRNTYREQEKMVKKCDPEHKRNFEKKLAMWEAKQQQTLFLLCGRGEQSAERRRGPYGARTERL